MSWSYFEDVLVPKTTLVNVSRVAAQSLNEPFVQTMTIAEAVAYGAWATVRGTMSSSVTVADGEYSGCVIVRGKRARKNGFPVDGKRTGNGWYAQVEITP